MHLPSWKTMNSFVKDVTPTFLTACNLNPAGGEQMRCDECGSEITAESKFCTECGKVAISEPPVAALDAPPQDWEQAGPPPQPTIPGDDQGPPPGYVPPHLQVREPTVRVVHLDDVLLLIAGALAVGVGFENLGVAQGQYVFLGLVAILAGAVFLGKVIAPATLVPLDQYMEMVLLGASALLMLWGLIAVFATNVGLSGGLLMSAGGLGLASMGLKLGMIK
jgi:hypothetical protein